MKNEKYYLDNEETRTLANYKKISSFINYLKDYEIPYKILEMEIHTFEKENGEKETDLRIQFDLMYCAFDVIPQNMKTFNELKEKWNL